MLRRQKLALLVAAASLASLAPLLAQTGGGPVVQVFNKDNGGDAGRSLVPIWRIPVQITASVNAGYDENVNTSAFRTDGSTFTSANIGLDYSFGTSRTKAGLHMGTGVTYYPDLPNNRYDPNIFLDLSVTHQANRRLTLTGGIHASYQAEPQFATDLGIDRRAGNYFSASANISASYQWLPRFTTVTSYSIGALEFNDANTAVGADNRLAPEFSQSFRFLYLPMLTMVADYRLGLASYDNSNRGSTTNSLLGGVDYTFLPSLQGTFRAGVEFRSAVLFADYTQESVGPHVEASLSYAVGSKTSLSWTASYSTEESNVSTSPGSMTFRTGLQVGYAFTGRISASLSSYYSHNDNQASGFFLGGNPAFTEDVLDFSLGLSYAINRHFSANTGYTRSEVNSDIDLRSYSRNRYSAGLTFNF